jgi:hypothetical protein
MQEKLFYHRLFKAIFNNLRINCLQLAAIVPIGSIQSQALDPLHLVEKFCFLQLTDRNKKEAVASLK